MAKVYVISRKGKLMDVVDRKLKKGKAKVGARIIKTDDVVTYKGKNYATMWMPTGKWTKKKKPKKYFIYPQGK